MSIGRIGEDLAVSYLKERGYKVIFRNFRVRPGELDIVCKKGALLVFVEVKAVAGNRLAEFNPEGHFTKQKTVRLKRAIEIFLIKNRFSAETEQRLDLIALELDENGRLRNLRHYENVSSEFPR